jgi:catalase
MIASDGSAWMCSSPVTSVGIELLRKAGIEEPLADGQDVMSAAGVVSTTTAAGDLSDRFFDEFAAALAKHRAWERETDSVPA